MINKEEFIGKAGKKDVCNYMKSFETNDIPENFDWRIKGAVSLVRD
jgi:hypothetical protein